MEEGKERERKKKGVNFSLQLLGHTLSLMEIREGPVGRSMLGLGRRLSW